jgi:hypothetical protein
MTTHHTNTNCFVWGLLNANAKILLAAMLAASPANACLYNIAAASLAFRSANSLSLFILFCPDDLTAITNPSIIRNSLDS